MHVSFFSQSFLTIIESIIGKIQMITPHQRMFIKKKINTYARVKNTLERCVTDIKSYHYQLVFSVLDLCYKINFTFYEQ